MWCGIHFQKNMYRHVIMTHNTDDLQLNAPTVKCEQCDFEGSHFYFPEIPITRKMHLMGFVISPLIATDKTPNICYKYLKLEQMGERLHAIWNLLHRTRFLVLEMVMTD